MEGSGTGVGRIDTYEDMFKEITRKLYGDDPDHRTSSVQNEFETSVSYKNDDDTGNGTDGSDEGNWTCEEEPLKGTDGSRIAAYHAGKATWRCYECGEISGGGPREVAEHFMELHSSRILPDDTRIRHHLPRKDYMQNELKIEDVITYLERLRERAETAAPPSRRTQETQTIPAALLPVSSTFLLQELPSVPAPQHLHQNSPTMSSVTSSIGKRYSSTSMPAPGIMQPDVNNCGTSRRMSNGGCNSKSHLKGSSKGSQDRSRYVCNFCPWSGVDNWCLKRHLNTHLRPFACSLCEYKAARSERLTTHVLKVHNRSQCSKCSYVALDAAELQVHQMQMHRGTNASNSQATSSAAQAASLPTNRQQQPIHPTAGGRPPPGPPVFPAPAPAITPATTVIPPTTLLG
ncbi:hypothetical protein M0804_004061 [Polistes exclamans]|nr:hypothetical protein M0804_004061 [Polistes exclamans]